MLYYKTNVGKNETQVAGLACHSGNMHWVSKCSNAVFTLNSYENFSR